MAHDVLSTYASREIAQEDAPEGVNVWADEAGNFGWTCPDTNPNKPADTTSSDKPKKLPFALTIGKLTLLIGPDDSLEIAVTQGQIVANRTKAPVRIAQYDTDGLEHLVRFVEPNLSAVSSGNGRDTPTPQQQSIIDLCTREAGATGPELKYVGVGGNNENGRTGNVPYKGMVWACERFGYTASINGRMETREYTGKDGKPRKSEVLAHVYKLTPKASNVVAFAEAAD